MEYLLMCEDYPLIRFDRNSAVFITKSKLPFEVSEQKDAFVAITTFINNRVLMYKRKYCKEILTSCGLDDQSAYNICVCSLALSFFDTYWIKPVGSTLKWKDVNIRVKDISVDIPVVALTGNVKSVHIDNGLYTGELTQKGTRAKGVFRRDDGLYLLKNETSFEIAAEISASFIAKYLQLPCTQYTYEHYGNESLPVSVCRLDSYYVTYARSVLLHFNEYRFEYGNLSYSYMLSCDELSFIKMMLFDLITLNVDRNRDNFGLLSNSTLCPIYDHDSCYKGQSLDATYFVTNRSFAYTLDIIRNSHYIDVLLKCVNNLHLVLTSEKAREVYTKLGLGSIYDSLCDRVEFIVNEMG